MVSDSVNHNPIIKLSKIQGKRKTIYRTSSALRRSEERKQLWVGSYPAFRCADLLLKIVPKPCLLCVVVLRFVLEFA